MLHHRALRLRARLRLLLIRYQFLNLLFVLEGRLGLLLLLTHLLDHHLRLRARRVIVLDLLQYARLRWLSIQLLVLDIDRCSSIEVKCTCLVPLLWADFSIVQLNQTGQAFDHILPVVGVISAGVVREPQDPQVWQFLQVLNLREVGNIVFPKIQLSQLHAARKISERAYFIERQRDYFDVWQLEGDQAEVFEVVSPEVYVLNGGELVCFTFG